MRRAATSALMRRPATKRHAARRARGKAALDERKSRRTAQRAPPDRGVLDEGTDDSREPARASRPAAVTTQPDDDAVSRTSALRTRDQRPATTGCVMPP